MKEIRDIMGTSRRKTGTGTLQPPMNRGLLPSQSPFFFNVQGGCEVRGGLDS